ncbi:MAG TPA: hypothetical protein DCL32_14585 [Gammaproteobacteria bacterium]|nr:hypothetical protein [Gammaproteobacteria bacterium]
MAHLLSKSIISEQPRFITLSEDRVFGPTRCKAGTHWRQVTAFAPSKHSRKPQRPALKAAAG